jgi:hypothetical protein
MVDPLMTVKGQHEAPPCHPFGKYHAMEINFFKINYLKY